MSARLYGVGVGPGAPDLLTLRAAAVLREAAVVAAPRRSTADASVALRIAREAVGEIAGQETLLLEFPMTRDPEIRRHAREKAARDIAERLGQGRSVAFVTEGDPLLYSTFLDLLREAPRAFPDAAIEVVPGITSITAVAAAARVPLADGDGKLAVLPAPAALDALGSLAREFDTLLLLKAGPVLPALRAALSREGLTSRALLVCDASTGRERVVRDLAACEERPGYFSTIVVTRGAEATP
ncbi:MAG TPA: precorrin-2 C(20)-methyltransferase [Anaeromyxobacter sp.]